MDSTILRRLSSSAGENRHFGRPRRDDRSVDSGIVNISFDTVRRTPFTKSAFSVLRLQHPPKIERLYKAAILLSIVYSELRLIVSAEAVERLRWARWSVRFLNLGHRPSER
jgi:hypothetical protein